MRFDDVVQRVTGAFGGTLPGTGAHARLTPHPPRPWPAGFDQAQARQAAVLLLLFPIDSLAHLILTVRATTLGRHSGQVSLPGGVVEPDETLESAALREAHEEIGLHPGAVRTLGVLTPVDVVVSGFRLYPVVGIARERQVLTPSAHEVSRVIEMPLEELINPENLRTTEHLRAGMRLTVPGFHVQGVEIWGATAMVLAEFLAVIE